MTPFHHHCQYRMKCVLSARGRYALLACALGATEACSLNCACSWRLSRVRGAQADLPQPSAWRSLFLALDQAAARLCKSCDCLALTAWTSGAVMATGETVVALSSTWCQDADGQLSAAGRACSSKSFCFRFGLVWCDRRVSLNLTHEHKDASRVPDTVNTAVDMSDLLPTAAWPGMEELTSGGTLSTVGLELHGNSAIPCCEELPAAAGLRKFAGVSRSEAWPVLFGGGCFGSWLFVRRHSQIFPTSLDVS